MSAGCMYCEQGERLASLMIKVCDLSVTSVYLHREQTYRGRCVLALSRHAEELYELGPGEQAALMEDICRVEEVMRDLWQPGKINVGMFGDTVKHVHVHLVPKQVDGPDWGGTFRMNPRETYLDDADYALIADAYRKTLQP